MLGAARDHLAGGVERQAGPVEHQIVLSADLVDEQQRAAPSPRGGRQHARAQMALFDGEGRGREVEDDLRAGAHQGLDRIGAVEPRRPEIGVVPDVLADGDPQGSPAERDGRDLGGRIEVAPLVEHVVRRQERLADDVRHPTAVDQRGAVVEPVPVGRLAPLGEPHQRRGRPAGARRRQRVERGTRRLDEGGTLEQILGRISAERQLGEDGQRGAPRLGRGQGLQHQTSVPVEVADGGIDLSERDLHFRVILQGGRPGVGRDKMTV